MKIRCIYSTGEDLRQFEHEALTDKSIFGRFGVSAYSEFNEIKVGSEYFVMGLIIFEKYQAYLIDDNGYISAYPCQLFEIIDNNVNSNWHFRTTEKNEDIYPFIQAFLGYYELCFDKKTYENLIIEKDEEAQRIYFRRKIELEKLSRPEKS